MWVELNPWSERIRCMESRESFFSRSQALRARIHAFGASRLATSDLEIKTTVLQSMHVHVNTRMRLNYI